MPYDPMNPAKAEAAIRNEAAQAVKAFEMRARSRVEELIEQMRAERELFEQLKGSSLLTEATAVFVKDVEDMGCTRLDAWVELRLNNRQFVLTPNNTALAGGGYRVLLAFIPLPPKG
jgi:hypothetical protein